MWEATYYVAPIAFYMFVNATLYIRKTFKRKLVLYTFTPYYSPDSDGGSASDTWIAKLDLF